MAIPYPAAPDLTIPATLQTVFLYVTIVAAVVVLAISVRMAKRHQSAVPILMVFGALAAILLEPVVTLLGHAVHPKDGQIMMFEAATRAIPWHIGLGYMAGFGAFYLAVYSQFMNGSLTAAAVWKTTAISALCYFLGEAYFVQNGLWAYYDHQPLWIWKGTEPPTWGILNSTATLTSVTLMLIVQPYLKGIAQLLIIPLAASGSFMGHLGAGFPMYNAMNSAAAPWLIELSGVASVLMAAVLVWVCTILLTRELQLQRPSSRATK